MNGVVDRYHYAHGGAARAGLRDRAAQTAGRVRRARPDAVLHLVNDHDEAAERWNCPRCATCSGQARRCCGSGCRTATTGRRCWRRRPACSRRCALAERAGVRRQPELACTPRFTRHQREWFAQVRERAAAGEPVAVLGADSPARNLPRALDIPYVVVQWWSSVIAAKQKAPGYLSALAAAGYPDDSEQYNSLPLGELLAASDAPWGGLPRPAILQASLSGDAMRQLFETWAGRSGAVFYPMEHSVDVRDDLPEAWWEELPEHWDRYMPGPAA